MKKVVFFNSSVLQCAIYQYGANFVDTLFASREMEISYFEPASAAQALEYAKKVQPVTVIYNWHPTHENWMADAPVALGPGVKHIALVHEDDFPKRPYDAFFYTSLAVTGPENSFRLPLLLPRWKVWTRALDEYNPRIGVSGFGGAWADQVLAQVIKEFESASVRLHLPFAYYGDMAGKMARTMADKCREMVKAHQFIDLEVTHDFMSPHDYMTWLSWNDMNCFLRSTDQPWSGVSASMCAALASDRPIAITRSPCFRHLWNCWPSVCVEDRSLKEILSTGTAPLEAIRLVSTPEVFAAAVETILQKLGV